MSSNLPQGPLDRALAEIERLRREWGADRAELLHCERATRARESALRGAVEGLASRFPTVPDLTREAHAALKWAAMELQTALDAASNPDSPEHAQVTSTQVRDGERATAWDEGYEAGQHDEWAHSTRNDAGGTTNPYRHTAPVVPLAAETCPGCQGTGGYWTDEWQRCPVCDGTGRVFVAKR